MRALRRFNAGCERLLGAVLAALVVGLATTVIWQVLTRLAARLANRLDLGLAIAPSAWTEELSGFLLAWIALLGAAYALRRGEHIGLDLLHARLAPGAQRVLDRLVRAITFAFAVVLAIGGIGIVRLTFALDQRTPVLNWPMGAIYLAVPIAALLMAAFAIERVFAERSERDGPP